MERCCPSRSALRENDLSAALGSPGGRWVECAAEAPKQGEDNEGRLRDGALAVLVQSNLRSR
jgi:hypothetical protein